MYILKKSTECSKLVVMTMKTIITDTFIDSFSVVYRKTKT